MKILVCASYLHAWNSIRPEAEIFVQMAALGHQITVMTQGEANYCNRLRDKGIKVIDCYPSKKICLNTIKRMRAELSDDSYDIVYAFNSKTIPNAAFACIGFRAKLIAYRGTTGGLYRHDFVAAAVVNGLMDAQMSTGVPTFSVSLTPHHFQPTDEHIGFFTDHFVKKGAEAADAVRQTLVHYA